jgi:CHAD domain-containing protein
MPARCTSIVRNASDRHPEVFERGKSAAPRARKAAESTTLPDELNHVAGNGASLAAALEDYCRAQIALVSEALKRRNHVYRGVHEARKGIRRLRSVIALGSPHFGEAARRIDASLRRLGRSLSQVRDAQVARDCARRKAEAAANPRQRELWLRMATALAAARTRTMRQARARDPTFLKRQATIGRIAKYVSALQWADIDPAVLLARLKLTRKRAGRAADRYLDEPRMIHLHRLRRRLRRYRMQITALSAAIDAPAPAGAARKIDAVIGRYFGTFERITRRVDQLGELLDRQLLRTAIRRLPQSSDRTAALALLRQDPLNPRRPP